MSDIMVSICCLVYNHKDYIRKALDSFLSQKTNFKFEILINDDCSTDGTTEIIKEYEAKYPDIIKPLYHSKNQYSKSDRQGNLMSVTFNFPRVRGKYVAMCEGDDFLTDDTKLQTQFDIMEKNPDCAFCAHTVRCTDEKGNVNDDIIPATDTVKAGKLTSEEAVHGVCRLPYMFQTSSYFFRSEYLQELTQNTPEFFEHSSSFDVLLMLYLASKGNFYYIDKEMSCYRVNSVSSIMDDITKSRDHSGKQSKKIKHFTNHLVSIKAFNEYSKHRFEKDVLYCRYKNEVHLMLINGEYKHLFDKKYKEIRKVFFKNSSKKEILYVRILSIFPWVSKLLRK